MRRRMKCTRRGWCWMMGDQLNAEANHGAGLFVLVTTNLRTFKQRCRGVAFRKRTSDRGMMLNFCPWCGADITWAHDSTPAARAKADAS